MEREREIRAREEREREVEREEDRSNYREREKEICTTKKETNRRGKE